MYLADGVGEVWRESFHSWSLGYGWSLLISLDVADDAFNDVYARPDYQV